MQKRFDPETHYALMEPFSEDPGVAETDHIRRKFLDVAYADLSPQQRLDIYLPNEGDGPFPVILSIHGGAFMGCDKSDGQVMPMLEGLKRGYAVLAINYRLSWEAIFPAMVHDAKAAVRWVRANAEKYAFDVSSIISWGGSAGGYLSSMLGTSAGIPEMEDLSLGNPDQPSHIQAVVDWFGPANFLTMDEQLAASGMAPMQGFEHSAVNSPESLYLGAKITEIPDVVKAANPETYIRGNEPPFLIQHGVNDPVVPVKQSIEFAEKLGQAIGEEKVRLDLIPGAEHADPKFETPENLEKVFDFIDRWLR